MATTTEPRIREWSQDEHGVWHLRIPGSNECYGCIEPDVFLMMEMAFALRWRRHNAEPGGYRIGG